MLARNAEITYKISDVAALLGVSAKTISRWDLGGKVPAIKRDYKGWRVFTEDDVKALIKFKETLKEAAEVN